MDAGAEDFRMETTAKVGDVGGMEKGRLSERQERQGGYYPNTILLMKTFRSAGSEKEDGFLRPILETKTVIYWTG